MIKSSLEQYSNKRDFAKSTEPQGLIKGTDSTTFVIQKHDATNLHYDFRIALDGVLKSWAIPKGPSTNPSDKRLAIRTEDHPLEYARFEGIIPRGQYGGGVVLVWDIGTYQNLKGQNGATLLEQLERRGHITIWLEGMKLKGGFALTRTEGNQWLFIKMRDKAANAPLNPLNDLPESVLTGRSIEEIRAMFDTYLPR